MNRDLNPLGDLHQALARLQRVSYWEGYMAAVIEAQHAVLDGSVFEWLDRVSQGELVKGELKLPDSAPLAEI